jgi:glycosyltransferase involved in cell wall biosynthesis
MTLDYVTTARLPSEHAHAMQIVENCAAMAEAGAAVTLHAAARRRRGSQPADPRDHYGVGRGFALDRVPCLDPTGRDLGLPFHVVGTTLALAMAAQLRGHAGRRVVYTRDPLVVAVLARVTRHLPLVYEAHQMAASDRGRRLHAACVRRAALVVAVTPALEAYARELGARRTIVAPTGVRLARFAAAPDRSAARARVGLPHGTFVVGYAGRLETLGVAKGVDTVVDAIARLRHLPLALAVVGGPDGRVDALRRRWLAHGLPTERFVAPGMVAPGEVPAWLAAFDVATIPFPVNRHFADCASPLKLFEYLAAGLPIVASDLPSTRAVLRHGETGLLVAPGDAGAIAGAIAALHADRAVRDRLARAARAHAGAYGLDTRARRLLAAIARA